MRGCANKASRATEREAAIERAGSAAACRVCVIQEKSTRERGKVWDNTVDIMRKGGPLNTGERIRRARKAAGLTQGQLGERIGKSKSLIWNYESGYREPDGKALEAIAGALGVTAQSLEDRRMDTVQDVLEVLFQMDEAGFGIEPVETKNGIVLAVDPDAPHAPKLIMALETWNEQLKDLKGGDISKVEYALWRGSFDAADDKQNE